MRVQETSEIGWANARGRSNVFTVDSHIRHIPEKAYSMIGHTFL